MDQETMTEEEELKLWKLIKAAIRKDREPEPALTAGDDSLHRVARPESRGWLVEKGETWQPDYLTIRDGDVEWTKDHQLALRMVRREDAEMLATLSSGVERIAEHSWA